MNTQPKGKQYYPFMDGFRAIAVFWVLFHHLFSFFNSNINDIFTQVYVSFLTRHSIDLKNILAAVFRILSGAFSCGNLGVDMFFVISGFLITGLLMEHIDTQVQVKRFYVRRFFKIYPQYLLAVIAGLIFYSVVPAVPKMEGSAPWSYLLFLQNYFPPITTLAHTWSLVVEEHFYLFYPIVLWIICSLEKDAGRRRYLVIAVCFLIVVLCNFIRYYYFDSGIPFLNKFLDAPQHIQTTLFRVDALAVGCLLKLFEAELRVDSKVWKFLAPAVFLLGVYIYSFFFSGKLSVGGFATDRWFAYTLAYLAPMLIFVAGYRGFFPVRVVAENPALRWLGRSSYGIYLWHYILVYPAMSLTPRLGAAAPLIIYVVGAVLAGIITTVTLERYFLSLRSRIAP